MRNRQPLIARLTNAGVIYSVERDKPVLHRQGVAAGKTLPALTSKHIICKVVCFDVVQEQKC